MDWELTKAATCFVLDEAQTQPGLYKLLLAKYCLWLAERQVALLGGSTAEKQVDLAMRMLQKAATKGFKLAHQHFDMSAFARRVQATRAAIDKAVADRSSLQVAEFTLPELHSVFVSDLSMRLGVLPAAVQREADLTAVIERTKLNLGIRCAFGPFVNLDRESLALLLQWSARVSAAPEASGLSEVKLFCRGFEDLAIEGCAMNQGLDCLDSAVIGVLEQVLDAYRRLSQLLADAGVHRVEQLSRC